MPSTILINAATGAASPEFTVSPEQQRFTVRASGLAGAETITLQVQVGGEFRNENEDDVSFTAGNFTDETLDQETVNQLETGTDYYITIIESDGDPYWVVEKQLKVE